MDGYGVLVLEDIDLKSDEEAHEQDGQQNREILNAATMSHNEASHGGPVHRV